MNHSGIFIFGIKNEVLHWSITQLHFGVHYFGVENGVIRWKCSNK